MCSNYLPVTRMDRMLTFFGVERERDELPHDVCHRPAYRSQSVIAV
jgi:hypothetical protein